MPNPVWYRSKDSGRLHCKRCRLPAGDKSRGHSHSHCWIDPSSSTGSPNPLDEPIRLSRGFSSELSGGFVRYLDSSDDPYEKALKALHTRYPRYAEVYWSSEVDGEKMKDIAERLGITPVNARVRKHRAVAFMEERKKFYEELDERDYQPYGPDDEIPHAA